MFQTNTMNWIFGIYNQVESKLNSSAINVESKPALDQSLQNNQVDQDVECETIMKTVEQSLNSRPVIHLAHHNNAVNVKTRNIWQLAQQLLVFKTTKETRVKLPAASQISHNLPEVKSSVAAAGIGYYTRFLKYSTRCMQ